MFCIIFSSWTLNMSKGVWFYRKYIKNEPAIPRRSFSGCLRVFNVEITSLISLWLLFDSFVTRSHLFHHFWSINQPRGADSPEDAFFAWRASHRLIMWNSAKFDSLPFERNFIRNFIVYWPKNWPKIEKKWDPWRGNFYFCKK